jgi:hypothetical protein
LELVRVASVEYTGADYEKLREVAGDLVVRTQEIEFQQRLRELTAGTEMNRFKSDYDLDEYVRQLAQEKSISLEMQQHEMVILKQVHRHELDKAEAGYQMAAEMEKTAHQIGVKIQWDDYTREKLGKNEELQIWITTQWLDVRLKKKQQEMDEAVGQLKLQEEKNRIAVAELRERAQILAGQDIKTLIALLPDNAQRTQLLELFRQTQAAGMGPGQILALQAGASPAVADALARMSEVRREDLEREFAERKKLSDDSAARLERVLTEALRAMAEQSKSRVQVNMPGPMV